MAIEVTEVAIVTADGERLAATLYVPDRRARDGRSPALMEALPYRKDDITESYGSTYRTLRRGRVRGAARRPARHRLVVGHRHRRVPRRRAHRPAHRDRVAHRTAVVERARRHVRHLVLRFQLAADGSRGGALGIPALRAVVATYATDDRYTDDVHYCGGVLRAIDLIDYPLYMVAMNALPPVPAVFGDGWRDEWRRRIDENPPWLIEWLDHPTDAPTWRRGSIRLGPDGEGYERMGCPTMLIVGWADGYRNNSFRVVEQYQRNGLPWRLLAGPWVHKSPERARPGPNVERRRRGARVLRRAPPRRPALAGSPRPGVRPRAGGARARPRAAPRTLGRARRVDRTGTRPCGTRAASGTDTLAVRGDVGVAAWNSCGGGLPWGQPLDQRHDNARSLVYDWPVADAARSDRARTRVASASGPTERSGTSASSSATCSPTARRR